MSRAIRLKCLFIFSLIVFMIFSSGCDNSSDSSADVLLESSLTVDSNGVTVTDETVAAEVTVTREAGTPETVIYTFTATAGEGLSDLTNGGLYAPLGGKISSATVILNGSVIFSQDDFNQNADYMQASVTLLEGDNVMLVTLQSQPDAKVTIRVLQ